MTDKRTPSTVWKDCVAAAVYVLEDDDGNGGELGIVGMAEAAQDLANHVLALEQKLTGKRPDVGIAYKCKVCTDRVTTKHLREHLEQHNPNARTIPWNAVLERFEEE